MNKEQEIVQKIKALAKTKKNFRVFWENFVFSDEKYFYKIPNFTGKMIFYKDINSYDALKNNFNLIKEFFWEHSIIAETDILKDWKQYIIKQKKIKGEILKIKDLQKKEKLKKSFSKIMKQNQKMWEKHWVYLDILGTDFILDPRKVHNIMTDWENLFLFDFWVINKNATDPTIKIINKFLYKLQKEVIKKLKL